MDIEEIINLSLKEKQSIIQDILGLKKHQRYEIEGPLSHLLYIVPQHTIDYLQEKFNITEEEINNYTNLPE